MTPGELRRMLAGMVSIIGMADLYLGYRQHALSNFFNGVSFGFAVCTVAGLYWRAHRHKDDD